MPQIRAQVLIGADNVRERLALPSDPRGRPVLLDVRWTAERPDGRAEYLAGHLPGAIYVPLDEELSAPPSSSAGRYPLPELMSFEASARRWGLHDDSSVIVYDDTGGFGAARAWWLLRWAGVGQVRILDGGLDAWKRIGGKLEVGNVVAERGSIELVPDRMTVIDADGASQVSQRGTLIDARAAALYSGLRDPYSPAVRGGHIPGAISLPAAENLDHDMRFLSTDALRHRFEDAGLAKRGNEIGVYCSTSINATHAVAALAAAGYKAALYPGSWVEWTADPTRPIE